MKKGFTLIELLVVVLIIGILSAIALPQYQKAVLRSRAAEIEVVLSSMSRAVDVYILENGTAADISKNKLSVSFPNTDKAQYSLDYIPERHQVEMTGWLNEPPSFMMVRCDCDNTWHKMVDLHGNTEMPMWKAIKGQGVWEHNDDYFEYCDADHC